MRQISYNWDSFARFAKVAMVDVDKAELAKPTLHLDRPIQAHLRDFLIEANRQLAERPRAIAGRAYVPRAKAWVEKYPAVLAEYWAKPAPVNPYCFGEALFEALGENEVIVTGDGTACVTTFQAARMKRGQRMWSNGGCASMGYDLPAAIGAWHALNQRARGGSSAWPATAAS